MKKRRLISKIISGVLCMSLFSTAALAAESKDKVLDIQSLDYDTAVEMAIKKDSSLKQIADQIDVTLKNRDAIFDGGASGR